MDEVDGKTLLESFMYGDAAGISIKRSFSSGYH